jgi:hypothetical protein
MGPAQFEPRSASCGVHAATRSLDEPVRNPPVRDRYGRQKRACT